MATLPGPDRPRITPRKKVVAKALKPKPLKTTKGNVYRSTPPKPRATAKVKAPAGAASPSSVVPYPEYKDMPWAQRQLMTLDAEQKNHQNYVTGTVAPWLSQGLTNLTGVDPAHPGINSTLQQQYLGNVQGAVGGALNAAATAAPAQVASTMPGGLVASPTAYLTTAAQQGAQGRASSMLQSAQIQSALNTMQPNTQAQGYLYALADYAKGLPQVYAERRAEARSKIDQFIAQQQQDAAKTAETMRHNQVTEAISATNASTNAAFQASRLGLSAQDQAFGQQQDLTAAATPAPYGYNRDPATGRLVRDPSIPTASSSGGAAGGTTAAPSAARGQYVPNKLRKEGFVGGWKVKPQGLKGPFVRATDGTYWRKPAGGSATSATAIAKAKGADEQTVYEKLNKAYLGATISDQQDVGTGDLLRLLRTLQPTKKDNFAGWFANTINALRRVDPNYSEWIVGWVKRRRADGTWKGTL